MNLLKNILFSMIFASFFIFGKCDDDDYIGVEDRKLLRKVLKPMHQNILDEIRWHQTNCHENPDLSEATELAIKVENLVKKLKNLLENVAKSEVDSIFEKIGETVGKMAEKMIELVKSLEPGELQFEKAYQLEEKAFKNRNCRLNNNNGAMNNGELQRIYKLMGESNLNKILEALKKITILWAMAENQEVNEQYFSHYDIVEDAKKELERTKKRLIGYAPIVRWTLLTIYTWTFGFGYIPVSVPMTCLCSNLYMNASDWVQMRWAKARMESAQELMENIEKKRSKFWDKN